LERGGNPQTRENTNRPFDRKPEPQLATRARKTTGFPMQ
jgi:hypothetical protein